VPFYLAADRDVHSVPAPGTVACRCCPDGISRSSRARRYPSDMAEGGMGGVRAGAADAGVAGRAGRPSLPALHA
jgi:hypothetical protein